jgi:hypothetical protein
VRILGVVLSVAISIALVIFVSYSIVGVQGTIRPFLYTSPLFPNPQSPFQFAHLKQKGKEGADMFIAGGSVDNASNGNNHIDDPEIHDTILETTTIIRVWHLGRWLMSSRRGLLLRLMDGEFECGVWKGLRGRRKW